MKSNWIFDTNNLFKFVWMIIVLNLCFTKDSLSFRNAYWNTDEMRWNSMMSWIIFTLFLWQRWGESEGIMEPDLPCTEDYWYWLSGIMGLLYSSLLLCVFQIFYNKGFVINIMQLHLKSWVKGTILKKKNKGPNQSIKKSKTLIK